MLYEPVRCKQLFYTSVLLHVCAVATVCTANPYQHFGSRSNILSSEAFPCVPRAITKSCERCCKDTGQGLCLKSTNQSD